MLSKLKTVTSSISSKMSKFETKQKQKSVNYVTEMENKMMSSISSDTIKEMSTTMTYTDYEESNDTYINCSNSLFNNNLNNKLFVVIFIFRRIF